MENHQVKRKHNSLRNFLADEKKSFMSEFLLKRISSKELEKLLVLMESRNPSKGFPAN